MGRLEIWLCDRLRCPCENVHLLCCRGRVCSYSLSCAQLGWHSEEFARISVPFGLRLQDNTMMTSLMTEEDDHHQLHLRESMSKGMIFNFNNWSARAPPLYRPHQSSGWFVHDYHLFRLHRTRDRVISEIVLFHEKERLDILVLWLCPKPIKKLIEEAQEFVLAGRTSTTTTNVPLQNHSVVEGTKHGRQSPTDRAGPWLQWCWTTSRRPTFWGTSMTSSTREQHVGTAIVAYHTEEATFSTGMLETRLRNVLVVI